MISTSLCSTPSHESAGLPRSCGETVSNAWRDVVSTFSQPFSPIIGILIQGIWKEGWRHVCASVVLCALRWIQLSWLTEPFLWLTVLPTPSNIQPCYFLPNISPPSFSLSLLLSVPAGWCVFLDRQSLCVEVCVCLSVWFVWKRVDACVCVEKMSMCLSRSLIESKKERVCVLVCPSCVWLVFNEGAIHSLEVCMVNPYDLREDVLAEGWTAQWSAYYQQSKLYRGQQSASVSYSGKTTTTTTISIKS